MNSENLMYSVQLLGVKLTIHSRSIWDKVPVQWTLVIPLRTQDYFGVIAVFFKAQYEAVIIWIYQQLIPQIDSLLGLFLYHFICIFLTVILRVISPWHNRFSSRFSCTVMQLKLGRIGIYVSQFCLVITAETKTLIIILKCVLICLEEQL